MDPRRPSERVAMEPKNANKACGARPRITTNNPVHGFHGKLVKLGVAGADAVFDAAARELATRFDLTAEEARDLLDGVIGRHMADEHRADENGEALIARLSADKTWKRNIVRAIRSVKKPAPAVALTVKVDEIPMLRFALDHAKSSISDAHPEDHAQLDALIARLEEAERKVAR
jgi:hypothetical protein